MPQSLAQPLGVADSRLSLAVHESYDAVAAETEDDGMMPYTIQQPTRVCAATGRPLVVGERIYSVLTEEAGQFVRKDYAVDAWTGPPSGVVAFWMGRIPAQGEKHRPTINDEVLVGCLNRLTEATEPSRLNFRYVIALLLMRRKRLKFEDVQRDAQGEWLCLKDSRSGETHRVLDPRLTEDQMTAVQDEVFQALGWE